MAVSPAGAAERGVSRSGWYVYTDFSGERWAIRLPAAIGDHPALGFEPLTDPDTPVLPRATKPRFIRLRGTIGGKLSYRKVPVGTDQAWLAAQGGRFEFIRRDGTTVTFRTNGGSGEVRYVRRRRGT